MVKFHSLPHYASTNEKMLGVSPSLVALGNTLAATWSQGELQEPKRLGVEDFPTEKGDLLVWGISINHLSRFCILLWLNSQPTKMKNESSRPVWDSLFCHWIENQQKIETGKE